MATDLGISETRAGAVTILELTGRLIADDEDLLFVQRIDGLVKEGRVQIIVDFHNVTLIDSGGVGTLVAKLLSVRRAGGDLRLLKVTDRTHRVLEITRLLSVFLIFESSDEAIRSFATDPTRVPAATGR